MDLLPFPVTPEGTPPCAYELTDTGLVVTGGPGTDLFVDPAGTGPAPDAGRLVGPPPAGDFRLSAKVTVGFTGTYDAGCLLLYADETHFAKLCFEYSPQHRPTAVSVVTRGTSDDCNSFEVEGDTLWLRVLRTGSVWAFHASIDGEWWRLVRYFALEAPVPVRVGFLAQSPTGTGCTATFAEVSYVADVPADLRSGT